PSIGGAGATTASTTRRTKRSSRIELGKTRPIGCCRGVPRLLSRTRRTTMIFGKFFGAIRAQLNKLANFFWEADPIAQMQYEYDQAVEQLKEGRIGLEQYRGLVERVGRQVKEG